MECRTSRPPTAHRPSRSEDSRELGAYPNPARDRLMITVPAELLHGTLEVTDSHGRVVLSQALGARVGFIELDVRAWADGLYLARVLRGGEVIGETKYAIVR